MQIAAPTLVLMCFSAHAPNAALPPALLTSTTKNPSSIRNTKIPAVSETAGIIPVLTTVSTVSSGEKFAASIAPESMPIKSDENTSLVMSASAIAIIGGSNAQIVPSPSLVAAPVAVSTISAVRITTPAIITDSVFPVKNFFSFNILLLFFGLRR